MSKRILHPLFHLLGSLTQQELTRQVAYLKEENKVLRERLPERISTTEKERKRLIRAGKKLGPQLKDLMSIVTYQSFRRWIREIEEKQEKAVEENSTIQVEAKKENGRPKTPDEVRELILKIKSEPELRTQLTLKRLRVGISCYHNTTSTAREAFDG